MRFRFVDPITKAPLGTPEFSTLGEAKIYYRDNEISYPVDVQAKEHEYKLPFDPWAFYVQLTPQA